MAVYSRHCTGTISRLVEFGQSSQDLGYHSGLFQAIAGNLGLPHRSNNDLQLQGVLASTMTHHPCIRSKQRRGKNTSLVGAQIMFNVATAWGESPTARCFALWRMRKDQQTKANSCFLNHTKCPKPPVQAVGKCLRLQAQRNRNSLSMLAMPPASSARGDSFMISKKESPPKRKTSIDRI